MGDAESCLKFFLLTLLNERLALIATDKALKNLAHKGDPSIPKTESQVTKYIRSTHKIWNEMKGFQQKGKIQVSTSISSRLPQGISLAPWREFQKNSTEDELVIVVWHRVLGLSIKEIAQALGVREGTIVHRLSRAFEKIGSLFEGAH